MPISFMGNYLRSRHYTGKLIHCFAACGQVGKRRELRGDFKFWSRHFCKGERNNCADICLADPVATCKPAVVGLRRALIEEVNGSLTNVIGLPMDEVGRALQNCGLIEETK